MDSLTVSQQIRGAAAEAASRVYATAGVQENVINLAKEIEKYIRTGSSLGMR